jgi:hypothetical protein
MSNKCYTLKFNSAVTTATLPQYIQSATKMRIRTLSYITKSENQRTLLIKISGWTDNNYYFDGATLVDYTKLVSLMHKTDSLVAYENTSDSWDVVKNKAESNFNTFRLEAYIDGVLATDISPSNPLYMEFILE